MHSIENDLLRISAKDQGAELTSIFKKSTATEYLWQADPVFWGRHAPVLFPIVGRLKEDQYHIGQKAYSMKQHGLARNLEFSMINNDSYSINFELKGTPKTLKKYPFPFLLNIQYTLKESDLIVYYKVTNPVKTPLYFSIGGHPAFNCPIHKGAKRSDYQLVFDEKETAATQRLTNGIRNNKTKPILKKEQVLKISKTLFDEDALVFDNLKSERVSLQKGKKKVLTFDFKGFPYLGIWSKNQKSSFVCIEPWYGIADKKKHNQQLSEKEGIIKLNGNESFDCYYTITIH